MTGPKITKLDDPNNPYNVKKTKTAAPTAAEQARNRAVSQAMPERTAPAPPPRPKPTIANSMMKRAQEIGQRARDERIESGMRRRSQ